MKFLKFVDRHFAHFGILGGLLVLTGFVVPQFEFVGKSGESYSILSHFVSELGWIGVSRLAPVFNFGLILGGLCFAIFLLGMSRQFSGILAIATAILGVFSALSCSAVGVFPVYEHWLILAGHLGSASCFFIGSFWTIVIASIMVWRNDHGIPRVFAVFGILILGVFASGLTVNPLTDLNPYFDHEKKMIVDRPEKWNVPIIEWTISLAIIGYLLVASLYFEFRRLKAQS